MHLSLETCGHISEFLKKVPFTFSYETNIISSAAASLFNIKMTTSLLTMGLVAKLLA